MQRVGGETGRRAAPQAGLNARYGFLNPLMRHREQIFLVGSVMVGKRSEGGDLGAFF